MSADAEFIHQKCISKIFPDFSLAVTFNKFSANYVRISYRHFEFSVADDLPGDLGIALNATAVNNKSNLYFFSLSDTKPIHQIQNVRFTCYRGLTARCNLTTDPLGLPSCPFFWALEGCCITMVFRLVAPL